MGRRWWSLRCSGNSLFIYLPVVEALIRQKLVTDEKLLKRICKRLVTSEKAGEQENERAFLVAELEHLELNLKKCQRMFRVHQQEITYYAERRIGLESEIMAVKAEIGALEVRLQEERAIRRNKDEYDKTTKEILKYSSTRDLQRNIEEVVGEIEALQQRQTEIQEFIEKHALAAYDALQALKSIKQNVDQELSF